MILDLIISSLGKYSVLFLVKKTEFQSDSVAYLRSPMQFELRITAKLGFILVARVQ